MELKNSIYSILIIVFSSTILFLSSCTDDNFVDIETEVEIEPSDTIPYNFITGKSPTLKANH